MEKEFIPYEQALALKELGFNEPCLGLYHNDKTFYPTQCKSHEQFHGQICSAPLYQQAFRWFREKYNVHMFPTKYDETKWWVNWATWTSKVFDTFEEAEFECLKKLIEIAKNE
jgi:hypothetical protein